SAFSSTGLQIQNLSPPMNAYLPAIYLAKGRFNWFSNAAQLAISLGTDGAGGMEMGIMSFNTQLGGTMGFLYSVGSSCHFGLAAGRLDSQAPNGQPNPNFRWADVATNCNSTPYPFDTANIYDVDPTNKFAITLHSDLDVTATVGNPLPVQ